MTRLLTRPGAEPVALPDSAARWQRTFDGICDAAWSGSDGAHSALLPDGRVLVMYGDTFGGTVTATGERGPDPPFFPNSMAIVSGDRVTWINAPGQPLIPVAADGTVCWPESLVASGRQLHAFVNRVRRKDGEVAGIHVLGQSLVTFDLDTFALRSVTTLTSAADKGDYNGIWWSAGAAIDGAYAYVYGVQLTQPGDYGRSVYVARVPAAEMAQPSRWRFWDGGAWTPRRELPAAARLISKEADTVVSVWRSGTMWHLVTQKYGLLGRDIALWTATSPQGPWLETKVLYTIPSCAHADAMFYEGTAHPEVPLASGKLLLSYSRNGSSEHIHADANWYKPQYVEASLDP